MTKSSTKSSNAYGRSNSVNAVWNKAETINGKNPDLYRKDPCGNEIYKHSYGKTSTKGWETDHIKPSSKGGSDGLRNLQAMQTSQNRSFGASSDKSSRH